MDFGCWKRLDSFGNSIYVPWGILMLTSSLVGGFSKGDGSHEHIRHIPMVGSWDWNELLAMLGFRQTSMNIYIYILLFYYYYYYFFICSLLLLLLLLFFIIIIIIIIIMLYIYTHMMDIIYGWLCESINRGKAIGCDWMWLASIISGMKWYIYSVYW
jgi:hypothetical protein